MTIKAALLSARNHRLENISVPVKLIDGATQKMMCSFKYDEDTDSVDCQFVPVVYQLQRALSRIAELSLTSKVLEEILRAITVEARQLSQSHRAYPEALRP